MKFIVSSTTLVKSLQMMSGVLSSSNVLPILDNFLFDLQDGALSISASDLETTINVRVPVKTDSSGNIAIPAKMLLDIIKTFPEMPLAFQVDTANYGIEISAGDGKYRLTGFDGIEFPRIQAIADGKTVKLSAQTLSTGIVKTLFATGNDDLRPTMNGVFFQLGSDNLTFVATDAHKLVRYRRSDAKSAESGSFIVPKKPLNLLKNMLGSSDAEVQLDFNTTNAFFRFGDVQLICRLVDGKYPNYEAVIPTNNPNKLVIDRSAFLSSIRRISLFSNKTTYQIRLRIAGSELTISAEDFDFNNAATERLTCQYTGEDMEIGFNAKFLIEMVTNLDSDNLILEMSAPNRAGILLPETPAPAEDVLMLVMPVMLNN